MRDAGTQIVMCVQNRSGCTEIAILVNSNQARVRSIILQAFGLQKLDIFVILEATFEYSRKPRGVKSVICSFKMK